MALHRIRSKSNQFRIKKSLDLSIQGQQYASNIIPQHMRPQYSCVVARQMSWILDPKQPEVNRVRPPLLRFVYVSAHMQSRDVVCSVGHNMSEYLRTTFPILFLIHCLQDLDWVQLKNQKFFEALRSAESSRANQTSICARLLQLFSCSPLKPANTQSDTTDK